MATGWNANWGNQQPLPPGWEAKYDPGIGRYYFINHQTKTTTWKDPRFAAQEQIQMQNIKPATPSTSAPQAHSRDPPKAKKKAPPKGSKKAKQKTQETSFIDDGPLVDLPKELSDAEKEQMKKKFVREFPGVDESVIQVALVSAKYNESKAKGLVKELRGDDDEQEKKRRQERLKERERQRKEREEAEQQQRKKREAELVRQRAAEREQEEASASRSAGSTPVSVTNISLLLGDKTRSDSLRTGSALSARHFISDDTAGRSGIDRFTTGSASSAALLSKPAAKGTAVKQRGGTARTRPIANAQNKTSFFSPLRKDTQGANKEMRSGPNASLLLPQWVQTSGPQAQNRKGPQRSNRRGPAPRSSNKMPLHCGPQANLRCGPQANSVAGTMYGPTVTHV